MHYAPVLLCVYNRSKHAQRTLTALQGNYLARDSELFIFSDGPRDKKDEKEISNVRSLIKAVSGFKSVTIVERERNLGLSQSIISGVTEVIREYGRVIVLEDDLVTSPYFLKFMNDSLSVYQNESRLASICGYMYPLKKRCADTLFLRVADCWGWATWKREWDLFVSDGCRLYDALKAKGLFRKFNLDGAYNYAKMLKEQIQNKNDSWAVRWYASVFLNNKLSLYPRKSLIMNIGFDYSGRHRGCVDYFKTELLNEELRVRREAVFEDERAVKEIGSFLRRQRFNISRKILKFFVKVRPYG
jgi:hypothetical protein